MQVEDGEGPAVDSQHDDQHADDVEHESRPGHIRHSETSEREADGIGWGGHRQHEGQGRRQSAGEHDIERVEADGLGHGG